MVSQRKLTRTQKRLLKAPRADVRIVSKAERLAHPNIFSARGDYVVSASVKHITSRTAFVTKTRRKDALEGVSHGTAAKQRLAGIRPYKTAASEAQAKKARETFLGKRSIAARAREVIEAIRPPTSKNQGGRYRTTDVMRSNYVRLRARKLRGEFLDDGDWHGMIDIAHAINDPMLSRLMKS